MISVKEAQNRLLETLRPLESEDVPIERAAGRVLAQPIRAAFDLPAFSNSSMDGFALRSADLRGASANAPVQLQVVADIPAGAHPAVDIAPGQAARIMTGAPVPSGADAVVPVERTDFNDRSAGSAAPERVRVFTEVDPGGYVRARGEDVRVDSLLLEAGVRLRAQDVGMAAMTGAAEVRAVRRPKVAVLSTGDELLPPGADPEAGRIFESNSLTIAALIEAAGAEALRLGIARDRAEDVRRRLDEAVGTGADLILSSAGVSVGAYDYVRSVVEARGSLAFWRVNMRPGKPLAFGEYRGVPFAGLPGNPVSAYVSFEVFIRPALAKLSGWTGWARSSRRGRFAEAVESDGRESYLRARAQRDGDGWSLSLTGHQGSGNQHSLVLANALAIVPAGVEQMTAGDPVDFWPME